MLRSKHYWLVYSCKKYFWHNIMIWPNIFNHLKFFCCLFNDTKCYGEISVALPVCFVSLLQVKSCYGSGGWSKHTAYISAADLGNSTAPVVYHVESRSDPVDVVRHWPVCVALMQEMYNGFGCEIHSKKPNTPDKTWRLLVWSLCRYHTPHSQTQKNWRRERLFLLLVLLSSFSLQLQPAQCFCWEPVLGWTSACTGGSCKLPSDHPDPSTH